MIVFGSATFADYAVIANNGISAGSISKGDLKNIFIGKMSSFGGTTVTPCITDANSAAGQKFFSEVLGMSADAYQKYWLEQELSGSGTAPEKKGSTADAVSFVSSKSGGICFINAADAGQASGKAKTLSVN